MTSPAIEFGGVSPILCVTDLNASVHFYVDGLGFNIDWQYEGSTASVSRGRAAVMLCTGDQGRPGSWIWFGISDVDAFHSELNTRGIAVRHPPTNYPWGSRELQVADPDGNVLRFGSEATDEPLGPWRDGQGRLWLLQPDGSWSAA
jgi:catechol 2,3-dioxygenase-like lactoylglutathione lyase family enzyme